MFQLPTDRLTRIAADGLFPHRRLRDRDAPRDHGVRGVPWTLALITTVATFVYAYIGFVLLENRFPEGWLAIWDRWDGVHYLQIARDGYSAHPDRQFLIIWLPLYPLLVRGLALLVRDYLIAGLLVAFAAYAATLAVFYRLVLLDFREVVARRAIVYLAIFPTAYFFHATYTESLFVGLVIGSFWAARTERWWLAGLLGGLASLTRITAFGLLPALALEYLVQKRFRLREIRPDVLYLLGIPAGFSIYLLINQQVLGDAFAFLDLARDRHFKEFSAPWVGAQRVFAAARAAKPSWFMTMGVTEIGTGIGSLLITIYVALRFRASYAVYMLLSWVNIGFNTWWVSTARYMLPLFPAFVVLALWGERKWVHWTVCLVSVMGYTLFMTLFVQGQWTF